MNKKPTKVISFRVEEDYFNRVNKVAKKAKKKRAELVEEVFTPAFEQFIQTLKPEKQTA